MILPLSEAAPLFTSCSHYHRPVIRYAKKRGQRIATAGNTQARESRVSGGLKRRTGMSESGSALLRILVGVIWLAVVGLAVALGWKLSRDSVPATPAPVVEVATPAANVVKSANSGVDAVQRQEVLKRIDAMPNVTATNKEHLYVYVERAQKIKRVLNVNFERGKTKLGEAGIKKIVEESRLPEFAAQAHDPAIVFVVLGFADKKGNEKTNLQVSLDRAEDVTEILRKHCQMRNIIQTVPMGVSDLFNPQDPAGNRVVEVWAVLP
jgi:outer membrane protein OmpA-like peptidoglycan-associated protein